MALVTRKIGTAGVGRDYSTVAGWLAAMPADLVAVSETWVGELYNDSEFLTAGGDAITGHTTSATFSITLTAAPGESFIDHASRLTNPLRYNQSVGVALRVNNAYSSPNAPLSIGDQNVLVSRIQTAGFRGLIFAGGGNGSIADSCIITSNGTSGFHTAGLQNDAANPLVRNCLLTVERDVPAIIAVVGPITLANCTAAKLGGGGTNATARIYGGQFTMTNCAIFGYTNILSGSGGTNTFTTCATDAASPPTGFTGSLTFADQFEDIGSTVANADYRLKAGAGLLDIGTTDTTNVPTAIDIIGTSRPQGSAWDIGCWELATGGGPTNYNVSLTEAGSAVDTVSETAAFAVTRTEAATAADTVSETAAFLASRTEAATAADSPTASAAFTATRTEAASGGDTPTALAAFLATITEAASAADSPSVAISGAYAVSLSEAASASDTLSTIAAFVVTRTEAASATDTISVIGPAPDYGPAPIREPLLVRADRRTLVVPRDRRTLTVPMED